MNDTEDRLGANGQSVEIMEIGGRPIEVDTEIVPLVRALNAAGLRTRASCSGHGHRPASIVLEDGREIVIARNYGEARLIGKLFPIDINGQAMVGIGEKIGMLQRRLLDAESCGGITEIDAHELRELIEVVAPLMQERERLRSALNFAKEYLAGELNTATVAQIQAIEHDSAAQQP
jgi:hypothetical protein